jgi:hypothetical protein
MKICLLLAATLLLLVHSSCRLTCIVNHLTARDKSWGTCYDSGQIVVFKSNLGHMDTFSVNFKKEGFTVCNTFELSDYQNNYLTIELKPWRCTCHDTTECKVYMDMMRDEHDSEERPTIYVFGLMSPVHTFDDYDDQGPYFQIRSVTLSTTGKHYDSAYVIEKKELHNVVDKDTKQIIPVVMDPAYGSVNSFYWDRHDGLIRYTTPDDEVFELYGVFK